MDSGLIFHLRSPFCLGGFSFVDLKKKLRWVTFWKRLVIKSNSHKNLFFGCKCHLYWPPWHMTQLPDLLLDLITHLIQLFTPPFPSWTIRAANLCSSLPVAPYRSWSCFLGTPPDWVLKWIRACFLNTVFRMFFFFFVFLFHGFKCPLTLYWCFWRVTCILDSNIFDSLT